jgi:hypothetical protein
MYDVSCLRSRLFRYSKSQEHVTFPSDATISHSNITCEIPYDQHKFE